jgi:DNA helicase-2/ATP-dependent DNA helicase PcrA
MMAEKYKNIFVVGDDDQSIYGFRGTNYENMNLFQRDFPDFKKIHLEQNYRSSQAILDISNKLISHNEYREEKELFSEREGKKSDVILRQVDDEKDEATYAIGLVKRLKDEGYNYSDIAILYRNSSLSRNFETEAIANSIPYKIYGGYSFTERAEIKDAVAYLRLLLDDDQLSFERIYNRPLRGVGKVTYDKIAAFLDEDPSIANAIDKSKDLLRIDIFENLLKLKDTVLKYRDLLEKQDIQVLFNNYLTEVGYFEYLTEKLEDEDKIQNVLELKSILVELEEDQIFNSNRERLVGLFDYVVLTESKNKKEQGEKDELLLSTIHSVKGLEFKVVILTAIENGILPYGYVSNLTIQELEEERRVAYVAITRAKEKVYLTHTQRRLSMGRGRMNIIPSIFLQDIFDSVKEANILNREKRNQIREDRDKFNVGDKVSHKTFGTGIIVSINANYGQIAFSGGKGIKKIFLSPKFLTII